MGYCQICGKFVELPYRCNYCGGTFCEDHRLPPAHNCANIEAWRNKGLFSRTVYEEYPSIEVDISKPNYRPIKVKVVKENRSKKKASNKKAFAFVFFMFFLGYLFLWIFSSYIESSECSENGICYSPTPAFECPPNYVFKDGSCIYQPPQTPKSSNSVTTPKSTPKPTPKQECPKNYVFKNGSCIPQLNLEPKIYSFKYCQNGMISDLPVTLYKSANDYFAELTRKVSCEDDMDIKMIENPEQRELLKDLIELIEIVGTYKDDQARIAISLVQKIPYDYSGLFGSYTCWNGYTDSPDVPRFPYQVLYDNKGVCSEKSRLLALLLKELGFGVVLLVYENERHMAVGIKCPKKYANYFYNGEGYCFIETTRPSIITDNQGEYIGAGKLTSYPKIIFVSGGMSFDSVYEEYMDAKEWQRLQEVAERNYNRLDQNDYKRWQDLVQKYCIEFD